MTATKPVLEPTSRFSFLQRLRLVPKLATQRHFAMALLISQAVITVTGSIVRVTGSGLGCPTWPDCQAGSLVPQAGVRPVIHQAIEFGNRLLTFVLLVVAATLVIGVWRAKRRRTVKNLAIFQVVLIVVQAIIGGLSVRMNLPWWSVALHFLPSMLLIWFAGIEWVEVGQPDDGKPTATMPKLLRRLAALSAIVLAFVLASGTMVTGAGRHAGDAVAGKTGRLGIDLAYIANIHAHFMYLYLGLVVGLIFALYTFNAPPIVKKTGKLLVLMILIQAAIGIIQFNFHVPRWTVPFHVGMSGAVTGITAILYGLGQIRTATRHHVTGCTDGDRARDTAIAKMSAKTGTK